MSEGFVTTADVSKIKAVLTEIERRKAQRRDFVYPAGLLQMNTDGAVVLGGTETFRVIDLVYTSWKDAEAALTAVQAAPDAPPGLKIEPLGKQGALPLNRTALGQLAGRLEIPLKYVDTLRGAAHDDLAAHNFTTLLGRSKDRFLVRTLDGKVRAVLSDRYRILDNQDVFFAAADTLLQAGADIWTARLTDDRMELFAVSKDVTAEVTRQFDADEGGHAWAKALDGRPDLHNAAVRISNSETGCGGLNVWMGMLRQVCRNTSVVGKAMTVVHLGRQNKEDGEVRYEDDTREAESKTVWLKLRDTIRTAFDPQKFQTHCDLLSGLTRVELKSPETAVAAVAAEYELGEERRQQILRSLFESRDYTAYGLVQAVTAQVKAAKEDEASVLEEVGGKLIEGAARRYAGIAVAA